MSVKNSLRLLSLIPSDNWEQSQVWSFIHRWGKFIIGNFHNNDFWNYGNSHAIVENRFSGEFSVNNWTGIIGNIALRHNSVAYRPFLENTLSGLFDGISLVVRRNMWFIHNGTSGYCRFTGHEYLNNTFAQKWIGLGGIHLWSL